MYYQSQVQARSIFFFFFITKSLNIMMSKTSFKTQVTYNAFINILYRKADLNSPVLVWKTYLSFTIKTFNACKKKSSVYSSNILTNVQNLCGKRDAWASQHNGRTHPLLYNFLASLSINFKQLGMPVWRQTRQLPSVLVFW